MTDSEFKRRLQSARKRVADFDKISGVDFRPLTIAAAVEAGIKCPQTDACFDAIIMLQCADEAARTMLDGLQKNWDS